MARTLLVMLVLGGAWIALAPAQAPDAPAFVISGYLPHYRFASFDAGQAAGLTDLVLFSAEPTVTGEIDFHQLEQAPWPTLRKLQTDHGVRLLVCVGGWGNSSPFPQVAASAKLRGKFAAAALSYCQRNQLNGIDLDWEYPRDAAEQANCALLLEVLHREFAPHGLLVSLTMAPWHDLPAGAYVSADRVQLMSYDYGQRHSTYEQAQRDVAKFVKLGVTPRKLVLGVPFYGRDIQHRERTRTWRDLVLRDHPEAGVNEVDGVFFNGPDLVSRKTDLALREKIGGLMIWEIGQDAPGEASLLKVIARRALQHAGKPATK